MKIDSAIVTRVTKALDELKIGKLVILVDNESRENEGDIVCAAEMVSPKLINFMLKNGSGIIGLSLTKKRTQHLDLPLMVENGSNVFQTAFTISIDAMAGVTTGVSAHDRAVTILTAIDDKTMASDLSRPGHVFPFRAHDGGVLTRAGHTEGALDLARLAGLKPAAALCELMNDEGHVASKEEMVAFAKLHELCILSISDIIYYRLHSEGFHETKSI